MKLHRSAVYLTEVDDAVVVLDAALSDYLSANATASLVLKSLVTGASLDELTQAIVAEFDVSPETARADCAAFVNELSSRGWLDDVQPGGPAR